MPRKLPLISYMKVKACLIMVGDCRVLAAVSVPVESLNLSAAVPNAAESPTQSTCVVSKH
jgi:hypothetical protein